MTYHYPENMWGGESLWRARQKNEEQAEMISLMGRQSACGSEQCPELTQPRWRWPVSGLTASVACS